MNPRGTNPPHDEPGLRRRLLLLAPTCDGEDVGEAWVSFQWAKRLAERHDVTLLTYHKRGKTPAALQLPGVRVIEWAEPPLLGRAERLNSMLKPGYIWYHVRARRWIRDALRRGETFDLAHQVVPVAMRYPSPVAGLGIPFLIGPVGGSLDTPAGFDDGGDQSPWYVGLRSLDRIRLRFDPLMRRTYDEADCVLGIAGYVEDLLSTRSLRRFEILSETAVDALPPFGDHERSADASEPDPSDAVRLLYVGRIIRTKGLQDALSAMARLRPGTRAQLDVVGDGFDREECEHLARRLGIEDQVRFHGWLERSEIDAFYRDADVFVFPSYREPGGNVAFEAMAHGIPLVVADCGGPGAATDDSCAIRIPVGDRARFVDDIASALQLLVDDPALRTRLGDAGRHRVAQIGMWDGKVDRVDELYRELVHAHGSAGSTDSHPTAQRV